MMTSNKCKSTSNRVDLSSELNYKARKEVSHMIIRREANIKSVRAHSTMQLEQINTNTMRYVIKIYSYLAQQK